MALVAPDEDETRAGAVVVQALDCGLAARHGAGRLRVAFRAPEGELEVAALACLGDRGKHADDVAVVQRPASAHRLEFPVATDERSVHAAAVDDEPACPVALERAVRRPCDQALGVRLEGDVVRLRQPPDGHV